MLLESLGLPLQETLAVGPGRGHFAVSLAPEPFDVHFASFTRSSASVEKGSALVGRLLVPWLLSVWLRAWFGEVSGTEGWR